MRPVVFGPAPLMEAALGVIQGKEEGKRRQREAQALEAQQAREAEDRDFTVRSRARQEQVGMLDLAQRRIRESRDTARAEARRAAAEWLRQSPHNSGGQFGAPGEPVDLEHDWEKTRREVVDRDALTKQLIAGGTPPDDADLIAGGHQSVVRDREARTARRASAARQNARLDAARGKQDRDRVSGWALATMQSGETDLGRLTTAAHAMNPRMSAEDVAGAVAAAHSTFTRGAGGRSEGVIDLGNGVKLPLPADSATTGPRTPPNDRRSRSSATPLSAVPDDDEIDAVIRALEDAGQPVTDSTVTAELLRVRRGRP